MRISKNRAKLAAAGSAALSAVMGAGLSTPHVVHADYVWAGGTNDYYAVNWYNNGSSSLVTGNNNSSINVEVNTGLVTISASTAAINVFDFRAGDTANSNGAYQQSGSTVTVNSWLRMGGGGSGSTGTYTLTGGLLNTKSNNNIGEQPNSVGFMNLSGTGAWNASGTFVGFGGAAGARGYLTETGGAFNVTGAAPVELGYTSGGTGTINISAGTMSLSNAADNALDVGAVNGSTGLLNVTGTGLITTTASELWAGNAGTGVININSGGTVNVGSWIALGRSAGTGTINLGPGGALSMTNTGTHLTFAGVKNVLNMTGGTLNSVSDVWVGEGTTSVWNMSGGTATIVGLELGNNATSVGTVNLTGGLISATRVFKGAGTGTFNFSGGTLQAKSAVNASSFMTGLTAANVLAGGAFIDSNGNAITIAQPLLTGTAAGVADGGLTKVGLGSLTLTGADTFTGLTTFNAGSIILGNPLALGSSTVNYVAGQAGSLSFGTQTAVTFGGLTGSGSLDLDNTTPAAVALTLGKNGFNNSYGGILSGAGSVTKIGAGLQAFTGANTYTGGTIINAGALLGTGATPYGPAGSAVTVNGGGALAVTSDADYINQVTIYPVNFNGGALQFNSYSSALSFVTPPNLVLGASPGVASSLTGKISGTGSLTFVGPGQLNLSSGNTYTGGTIITGGTLAIADDTSINSTVPTFNTSGVGLLQFLSPTTGLTFASGNNNLSVPAGSTTTVTNAITGTAEIYFAGPGTLVLGASSTNSGGFNVSGGILNFAGTLGTGNIVGNGGTLQYAANTASPVDLTAGRSLIIAAGGLTIDTNGNNVSFANSIGGPASGTSTFTGVGTFSKTGLGTLTDSAMITSAVFYTRAGSMTFTGAGSGAAVNNYTSIGVQPGDNGTLNVGLGAYFNDAGHDFNVADVGGGGTVTATDVGVLNITDPGTLVTAAAFYVGKGGAGTPLATGTVNMTGGSLNVSTMAIGQYGTGTFNLGGGVVTITASDSRIGNVAGSVGVMNITGGTVNALGNFQPGYAGTGTINQTGGTFNHSAGFLSIGRATGGVGYYNISGGTLNETSQFLIVGEQGTGTLNVSGTAVVNATKNLVIGNPDGTGATGTVVQSGGTVTAPMVIFGNGVGNVAPVVGQYQLTGGTLVTGGFNQPQQTANVTSTVLLNGGTMQLSANNASGLFGGISHVTVGTGGALINTNGFSSVVRASLTGSAGDGGLTKSGTGTLAVAASQAYTGVTNITGGTLQLQGTALPVTTGLVEWYDAADTSTLVTNGTNVTAIQNKGMSGAALNVTASATTGYAQVTPMGQNGKTNLALNNTSSYNSSANSSIYGANDRTEFIVGSRGVASNTTSSAYLMNQGALATNNAYGISIETGNTFGYTYNNDITFGVQNPQVPVIVDTTVSATGTSLTGDLISPTVSTTPVTTSKTIAANTTQTVQQLLGRTGNNSFGTFDESLEYDVALSPAQTAAVEAYLEYKWFGVGSAPAGTTNLLPTTGTVNIASGAVLDLNGVTQTLAGLTGPTGSSVTLGTGTLTVANSAPVEFDGIISGAGGLNVAGTSTFTVGGLNTYTGDTNVSSGAQLNIASGAAIGTGGSLYDSGTVKFTAGTTGTITTRVKNNLAVGPGALLTFETAATHASRTLVVANTLSIDPAGSFNLSNNDLDLNGSSASLSAVTQYVANGFNYAGGANWQGSGGIRSSAAAADTSHLTALGVIQNNQGGTPLFGLDSAGQVPFDGTNPGDSDILVKYTYFGDANLDGKVDGSDYSLIDAGYAGNGSLTGWYNGDFNYDGVIDGSDYTLIDNAFNNQGAQLTTPTALVAVETAQVAPSAVPEPASLGILAVAAAGLFGRRRRA